MKKSHSNTNKTKIVIFILLGIGIFLLAIFYHWDPFWYFMDNTSNLISLVQLAVAIVTWFAVLRLQQHTVVSTYPSEMNRSIILVFDIGNSNILEQVRTFCLNDPKLSEIVNSSFQYPERFNEINKRLDCGDFEISCAEHAGRTVLVSSPDLTIDESTTQHFYQVLGELKKELQANAGTTLHIFYKGPTVGSFYIGEIFSNTFPTYIYYHPTDGNGPEYIMSGMMDSKKYLIRS